MIVTLTMNPAVDRTLTVDRLIPGEMNRIEKVHCDAGGKGINVSRALTKLGLPSLATGFLGGLNGRFIADCLHSENIESRFVWLRSASTRTNTKIVEKAADGTTELNEPGPLVTKEEENALWKELDLILFQASFLICSGGLPPGIEPAFYRVLIEKCQQRGVKSCLDTSGLPLIEGVQAKPYFVKPNREEAEELLGRRLRVKQDVVEAMQEFSRLGIPLVVISLGEEGALFFNRGQPLLMGKAAASSVRSTIGCGDALVAAMVFSLSNGYLWKDAVRWSLAVATATAEMASTDFPELEGVAEVLPRVQIEEISIKERFPFT